MAHGLEYTSPLDIALGSKSRKSISLMINYVDFDLEFSEELSILHYVKRYAVDESQKEFILSEIDRRHKELGTDKSIRLTAEKHEECEGCRPLPPKEVELL